MKKLLVAAIGAAAAIGAFADYTSHPTRFEGMERGTTSITALNTQAGDSYWAEYTDNTKSNNYSIVEREGVLPAERPLSGDSEAFEATPTNALNVATQFGKPLEFKADASGSVTIPGNLYFDSLVKFTVCEDAPTEDVCTNAYKDAKIVMWLQCDETAATPVTNLWVMAGYLSYENSQLKVVSHKYQCDTLIGPTFADGWHRVTIKAISDITTDSGVPGFAIYIDGQKNDTGARKDISCSEAKWDPSFSSQYSLSESAQVLNGNGQLFPSLIQDSSRPDNGTITAAGFDGTGWVNDLVFTTTAPFAAAEDKHTKKAEVNGESFTDLAEAVYYINNSFSGETATLKLFASLTLDKPLVFTTDSANVVLDFAGFVLTNEVDGAAITNSAANLVITNSNVGVGGIYCSDANGGAIATVGGATTINDGWFYGNITVENANLAINGGCFKQGYQALKSYLPSTKVTEEVQAMGLTFNKVVDYVPEVYTITFNTMGGAFADHTEATQEVTESNFVQKPTDPEKSGATFVKWVWDDDGDGETPMVEFIFDSDPEERESTEVTDDYVLFAEWYVVPKYTVTFRTNNVEFATQNVTSNSTATAPSPAPTAATGYTFNGWYEGNSAVAYDFATPVTGDLTLDAKFDLVSYTITYKTAEGETFTSWASEYTAPASFTVEVPAELPAAANVSLALGVTFNGWTNAVGTAVTTTEGLTADLVVFADVTVPGPSEPTIDPASSTTVEVTASSKQDAIDAVAVAAPAAAGIDTAEEKAAYKNLFDIDATNKGGDTWDVEIKDIKEQVKIDVAETAEAIVSGTKATGTVTVPKGLYYKVTTYTTLGGTPNVVITTTLSTGAASSSIAKPGDSQGFIKVEMATTAEELAD